MTSRTRMLIALDNKRPGRLPCRVHGWLDYYLKTYLGGAVALGVVAGLCAALLTRPAGAGDEGAAMAKAFSNPPASCRPHTRWWWMGNATTKEELSRQLEQMHEQGIGGVEQITMTEVYEKGNTPYLSDEFFGLVRHAIEEAKQRGMEFSLNFGGPGWVLGGTWLPPEDCSQNMVPSCAVVEGGRRFAGTVPTSMESAPHTGRMRARDIRAGDRLLAVVAGRLVDGVLDESSLTDLTARVSGRELEWDVPEGRWQLMAFWLVFTGQSGAVNHVSKGAMERYCESLGGRFREAFGDEFGKTVDSLFCDSFEVTLLDGGIYWSAGLLDEFRAFKGYDLTPYLPAIWWNVGEVSPKIRYDVNEFLHHVGIEAFFKTFLGWCEANGVAGRIQPYGFVTDIIEGAGMTHFPEMEITAGEKDAVPWFDTRIGPKKYVASGAHLYGRNVVTVEAYTYLHWEPYRATLEELKIASDVFLRSGANKFYNHGYTCSPERDLAPSRRFFPEIYVNDGNVWWPYYRALSDYIARCCYLLRQGRFVADVAVYSPLASQWSLDARDARRWTRDFNWGGLGRQLLANGYDFDLINDDVLQHRARLEDGVIRVGELEYRALLLPNIRAMPLASLERVRDYVRGGGVVFALERVPECSTGFADYKRKDAAVRAVVEEMFDKPAWRRNPTAPRDYGKGRTYHVRHVIDRSDVLECTASALDPFLNALRRHVTPDFGIDFVRQGLRENDGLAYIHRRTPGQDIYFVTNIQDRPVDMDVAFRVSGRAPARWSPYDGQVAPLCEYEEKDGVTRVRLRLAPYASTFVVFEDGPARRHVTQTSFREVLRVDGETVEAIAGENGLHIAQLRDGALAQALVEDIPGPFAVAGEWRLTLDGRGFRRLDTKLKQLASWTDDPRTKHFSGTGTYEIAFDLPVSYFVEDLVLEMDLGDVGNVAEVELNGEPVGLRWIRGQVLDVTGAARPGRNALTVKVTNTLINRVAGLKELPPVPEPLRARYGNDRHIDAIPARALFGYEPLPNSGLLGPVTIHASKRVRASMKQEK
jgi:glycosyl hydrolase family 106( putative alpha-L-rhamnosidase)